MKRIASFLLSFLLILTCTSSIALNKNLYAAQKKGSTSVAKTKRITTTVSKQDNKNITVYVTKTGKKYHAANCESLKKSSIPISLSDAKAKGYSPCSKCNPPR